MEIETLRRSGPLLQQLMVAQSLEQEAVGHERIGLIADAVSQQAAEIGSCLLWPIGAAAERVAGVVTARSDGTVEVGAWNTPVDGRRVLLFTVVALTPIGLQATAQELRSRRATAIHACAVRLGDFNGARGLDSCRELEMSQSAGSLAVAG